MSLSKGTGLLPAFRPQRAVLYGREENESLFTATRSMQ
jgi:hypothetical protein